MTDHTEHLYFELPIHHCPGGEDYLNNWTRDCQGKLDYDPALLWFSCRTYPDGGYIGHLYLGNNIILETGVLTAPTQAQACREIEKWVKTITERLAAVIQSLAPWLEGHQS